MILNFYGATSDWPSNNWVAARRRGPESMGFQFFVWDAELSLGAHSTVATNHLSVRGGVADIFQNLRTHERFRNMVANRVKLLFAPGGALSTMHRTGVDQHEIVDNRSAARYYGLSLNVELALIAESARWGDEHRPDAPYLQTDWQKTRDALLSNYFSMRASNVFQQFVAAGMVQTSPGPRLLTDDTIKQLRLRAHQEHWRVN